MSNNNELKASDIMRNIDDDLSRTEDYLLDLLDKGVIEHDDVLDELLSDIRSDRENYYDTINKDDFLNALDNIIEQNNAEEHKADKKKNEIER